MDGVQQINTAKQTHITPIKTWIKGKLMQVWHFHRTVLCGMFPFADTTLLT